MTKAKDYVMAIGSLGDYRAGVVRELRSNLGSSLTIYAGAPSYDLSIRLLDYQAAGVVPLVNRYVGPDILFQSLNFSRMIRADSLILDLNPRIPHVWLITLLRRLLGKPTALWGHAWPRSGPDSRSEFIRHSLRKLATGLVSYTEAQAEGLRARHPGKKIVAAPNALYSQEQMGFDSESQRHRILYVGRLVKEKKPDILIDAFERVGDSAPNIVLTIVGDGPERKMLEDKAAKSQYHNRIEFPGYISDFERLRPIYAEAIVSVSPGYVGLSITQSLAFGVPMLVSKDENHSPEIECAIDGFNCAFFKTDDADALAEGLLRFVDRAEEWQKAGPKIASDCARRYSVERMAQGILEALVGN